MSLNLLAITIFPPRIHNFVDIVTQQHKFLCGDREIGRELNFLFHSFRSVYHRFTQMLN